MLESILTVISDHVDCFCDFVSLSLSLSLVLSRSLHSYILRNVDRLLLFFDSLSLSNVLERDSGSQGHLLLSVFD